MRSTLLDSRRACPCKKIRTRNRRVLAIILEMLRKVEVKFVDIVISSRTGYSVTDGFKIVRAESHQRMPSTAKRVYQSERNSHRVCTSDLPIEIAPAIMKVGQSVVSPVATAHGDEREKYERNENDGFSRLSEVAKASNGCRGLRAKKGKK